MISSDTTGHPAPPAACRGAQGLSLCEPPAADAGCVHVKSRGVGSCGVATRAGAPRAGSAVSSGSTVGFRRETVTKMLQRMEQAGFVSRRRAELDRRVVFVSATRAGQALRAQVEAAWQELEALTLAGMTPQERAVAMKALKRMERNLAGAQSGAAQTPAG
ncbi:MarR family winged helix-turn-helix transcriptional regulator [Streptomyces sp. A1136]|uniref:MarR family winged helix-turn-helix transcriptional regulator n=1 Tax=Streptomyces sp. A1136 TaxID=2563102 RepID=UPI00109E4E77|nr:MarR family winged helix-turn-helix transcriptional regulator [Streptomyces sp. A1136]THA49445.1 MarR family transcriptional regulator [Streptomyces sp. A1136]